MKKTTTPKKPVKDFSKPTRYSYQTREWYGEKYNCIGEEPHGDYVSYSDYMELLDRKAPYRGAKCKDVVMLLQKRIKNLEKETYDVFHKKDKMNYDYAIGQHQRAETLRNAIYELAEISGEAFDDLLDELEDF